MSFPSYGPRFGVSMNVAKAMQALRNDSASYREQRKALEKAVLNIAIFPCIGGKKEAKSRCPNGNGLIPVCRAGPSYPSPRRPLCPVLCRAHRDLCFICCVYITIPNTHHTKC